MRLRHIKGAEETIASNRFVIQEPEAVKGHWQDYFAKLRGESSHHHLHIEVGMGKGRFLMDMAEAHPDINYIGIEMYSSVLLRGLQKMEERNLNNLRFLRIDATYIEDSFEKGEVDRIYLNFSDPWPKDRHAKRRLPGRVFLKRFAGILVPGGNIEFKTDNRELFDFALEEVEPAGYDMIEYTFDLHNNEKMMAGNIMTEYEEKFSSMGNPICKYIIRLT